MEILKTKFQTIQHTFVLVRFEALGAHFVLLPFTIINGRLAEAFATNALAALATVVFAALANTEQYLFSKRISRVQYEPRNNARIEFAPTCLTLRDIFVVDPIGRASAEELASDRRRLIVFTVYGLKSVLLHDNLNNCTSKFKA